MLSSKVISDFSAFFSIEKNYKLFEQNWSRKVGLYLYYLSKKLILKGEEKANFFTPGKFMILA
jgi:hypothetical protein